MLAMGEGVSPPEGSTSMSPYSLFMDLYAAFGRFPMREFGSTRRPQDVGQHITAKASRIAYERAGVGPQDISLAEVHDATAIGEIVQSENLGFCEFGAGGALAESGATTIGGRIPINTSGGLESKGHPIGATGLGQLHELVTQLRGEAGARQVAGARLAIAENGGGIFGIEEAVCAITILGR
jgi:acetyl-CoA acetyltransferase